MRVALLSTYSASKKEPLATLVERIHRAFMAATGENPQIEFAMTGEDKVLDRVLKRHPVCEPFDAAAQLHPNGPVQRMLSNSAIAGELELPTLLEIAAGVPRSYPFHNITLRFRSPVFGGIKEGQGIQITDSWWISGRQRTLTSIVTVEAALSSKKLPLPEGPLAAVLASCGKPKKTVQTPLSDPASDPNPASRDQVMQVAAAFRSGYADFFRALPLPHDLPPAVELLQTSLGLTPGPKKPPLEAAFRALGYDCRGESGTFTLRRKTSGNLTAELYLDVGTWSNSLSGSFSVKSMGFTARVPVYVTQQDLTGMQYPIGDAPRWQQIIENLVVLVKALDREFVPALEAAAGPTPAWFTPPN